MNPKTQTRLYDALKRIAAYESPEWLNKNSERAYGLSGEEAIGMAYENVLQEARSAIKGVRRPNVTNSAQAVKFLEAESE